MFLVLGDCWASVVLVFIRFGKFQLIFLQVSFQSFTLPLASIYIDIRLLEVVPQFTDALLIYSPSLFSLSSIFDHFYCYVSKFTNDHFYSVSSHTLYFYISWSFIWALLYLPSLYVTLIILLFSNFLNIWNTVLINVLMSLSNLDSIIHIIFWFQLVDFS